ncbi:MAG: DUF177 domain-containing protein [Defluviitaleaceae bacterium]|nr:DUF177 domain-containing protein [Defluviitaleaceae bacterium]
MYDIRHVSEGESITVKGEVTIPVPVVFGLKSDADVEYTGELSNTNEGFLLEGEASTVLVAHCNRCLKTCRTPVTFTFSEIFVEKGVSSADGWELEYTNNEINIKPALERNLFNNIPMKFVCDDNCGGICPRCGRDQNLQKCGCENNSLGELAELLARFK